MSKIQPNIFNIALAKHCIKSISGCKFTTKKQTQPIIKIFTINTCPYTLKNWPLIFKILIQKRYIQAEQVDLI